MASYPKSLVLLPLTLCIFYITSQLWHRQYYPHSRPLLKYPFDDDSNTNQDCDDGSCFKSRDILENPDYEDEFKGKWELASENSGISAMHIILFPNTNKAIMLDAVSLGPSNVRLPVGIYRLNPGAWQKYVDYRALAVEYDAESAAIRPLKVRAFIVIFCYVFSFFFFNILC